MPEDSNSPSIAALLIVPTNILPENGSNQWYNYEHGPAHIKCKLQYEARDELKPKWLAAYEVELEDISLLQTPGFSHIESCGIYRKVLCKGQFQPTIGTVLITVRLLVPLVNANELKDWYDKEHINMLAEVPGWIRSRLLLEETSSVSQLELVQYMALHEYLASNGLGGAKHSAAMNTAWRTRIMSLSIGGPVRRDFQLIRIY